MIEISSKYAHTHISTNGMLIDEKAEKLITSGLGTCIQLMDIVKMSMKNIGLEERQKSFRNIKLLNKINNYYSNPVTILPQYIVFDHNYDEVEDFKKFCENLNLRFIFKKPYIRYGDKVKESNDPKYQRKKYLNEKEHLDAISKCPHAHSTMTITANGRLLLCAQDYNGDWNIGNILDSDTTVESLWNNSYYKSEEKIINKIPPKLCTDNCMIYNPDYKLQFVNNISIAKIMIKNIIKK